MTTTAVLRDRSGWTVTEGTHWVGPLTALEREILTALERPVLDVGCGPGRHVVALAEAGIPSLGIDVTPVALRRARANGALVLERSVFERVPGAGRWGSALLLDGNLGIGADPVALLARIRDLLRSGGRLLVEVREAGCGRSPRQVRLEVDDEVGPWFGWVDIGADQLAALASTAGFTLGTSWVAAGRHYRLLEKP